jgi:hypothetical protein
MSLHAHEQFLAAVAAALGESVALVRRRGFHLEMEPHDLDPRPARRQAMPAAGAVDDAVDMRDLGLDWDAHDDSRLHRSRRRAAARRRKAA